MSSAGLAAGAYGTGHDCLEDAALLLPPAMGGSWGNCFCVPQKEAENPLSTQMNKESGDLASERVLSVDQDSRAPLVFGLDALMLLPGRR